MSDDNYQTEVNCSHVQKLLLQAEEEFQCDNIEVALYCCKTVIESLQPYIDNLSKRTKCLSRPSIQSAHKKNKSKPTVGSGDYTLQSNNLSHNTTEWDPVKFLSIGELTELITNPPGSTCSEAKFGKAFAIYGEEFARSVFKIVKGTSAVSLKSLAQWSMIGLLENYCHNIIASGNTPKFDDGPDPVLFCPVHDSSEMRFDDNAVYPTTAALSNVVRKFVQDLDLCHLVQASLFTSFFTPPDGSFLPVCFHTDLSQKQKILSVASYKGNWLSSDHIGSILKQHELCRDPALLYSLTSLKRAHCYFVMNQSYQCAEDSSAVLKVPAELPNSIKAIANLLKAKCLYRAGTTAKEAAKLETKESDIWKTQLQYLRLYRTAAQSFAYALEIMNESEFNLEMHECNIEMVICLHEVLTAQRSDCQLKTCCLCWKNSHLSDSHIFPKFILELLREEVGILVGNKLKGPRQVHYPMLCNECEQRFCNWGEKHFKSLFLEKVRKQPSKKLEISHGHWLYYFFASLIWRVYFQFKYKAASFSEILRNLPLFAMRKFLLTGDIQHLTTDCFLYLFVDKDVFDEVLCKTSCYKSLARKGGGCSFHPDESLYICYFLNFFLVFPIHTTRNAFLVQGSLKQLKFGKGVFEIEVDSQRIMPVFLERYLCKVVVVDYDNVLSSLTHQTYDRISRSLYGQERGTSSNTTTFPRVIRCLPSNVSVTFNPIFKYGIELQGGFKVKYPPIDCKLAEELDKRYALYLCEEDERNLLALYRVYSPSSSSTSSSSCDHVYAFQFSLTSSGEVSHFSPCENIRNKQYFKMLLNNNPVLQDFLKTITSVIVLSEAPPLEIHFFPKGAEKLCGLQPDGSLLLPSTFAVTGKPVKFKYMMLWLCELENFGTVAILRIFCEIAYDEMAPYDYLAALQFHSESGEVKSIEPLHPPQKESAEDKEIMKHLLESQSVCISSIELMQDPSFYNTGVVCCLEQGMCVDFFPISRATSTDNLVVLNELGTVVDPVFELHSWLCSYTAMTTQESCLVVLQKWKISNSPFVIAFTPRSLEKDVQHISSLSTLPGTRFTSIFMKMVKDYCSTDFDIITRNVLLTVQAVLKINPRVRSIFTNGCDPLMMRKTNFNGNSIMEESALPLDPVVCLPSGCSLKVDRGEVETLQLSADYSLLCSPLKTPLYTVWLCVYKDVQELIVVKTTSGIENVCSSVVVTLDFVAAQVQTTHSAGQFRFYPFLHLNADESAFVEEDFLIGETFQNNDPQFCVLMACVKILLSQLYQSHNLQTYLPLEFQVDIAPDGELQLMHPKPFVAGPLYQETSVMAVTCWLCEESLGIVKIENKSSKCQYITALTFRYSGTTVSKLELVELPSGTQFLVQHQLYLDQNSSCLTTMVTSMFNVLCNQYTMGEICHKSCHN